MVRYSDMSERLDLNSLGAPKFQKGAVLMIVLLLVIVIAILGVAAMRTGESNSKVSISARTHVMTFQAAEAGTRMAYAQAQLEATQTNPPQTIYDTAMQMAANTPCVSGSANYPSCIVMNCVNQSKTVANPVSANCTSTDRLDASQKLQTVTQTTYVGTQNILNTSLGLQEAMFQTESVGCMPETGQTCVVMSSQSGMSTPQISSQKYSDTVVVIARPMIGSN